MVIADVLRPTYTLHRLLDTLHLMFVTHAVYWFTITNFGDFLALEKAVWCVHG
jgi:hypothetical protein